MKTEEKTFKRSPTFTPVVRFFHWVRAFSIFFLIFSGFYIAYPFFAPEPNGEPTNFLYALFRSWHIMVGFLLISVSIFRLYLFLVSGRNKNERMSASDLFNKDIWIGQIKNYLFLGPHPHIKGVYNPIQFCSYFLLAILVLIISLTGIVLYYNVYHNGLGAFLQSAFKWFEVALGGLANVRKLHHITTWAIMIFIPIHVYMVVWNAIKHPDGGADSIIGGFRYQET
ncbi:Ni/Fe-hydrogenase, b-type cytochrome subunit [Helicobacter sp. MIT 14-3879]|uniref:Ni/Fe-hydrogenase, b-type cytochrome subunit n=1 Tax=Helicobacter sp. MIT 14-3879 TaxID=2040649 RepID=UPI000E1E90F5|nr:Ni/Fe-hydrogenase, b-type cytochrome subunit [Helicobacter sp. MIT 14-3879]RDU64111.1 Ni/Fe-hydrogenase, b-type cytochrome subunit [Helicobacter sp. MIT 14-3879]